VEAGEAGQRRKEEELRRTAMYVAETPSLKRGKEGRFYSNGD